MKITHVDGFSVKVPAVAPPFKWRSGLLGSPGEGHLAVLRIRTDDGCEGVVRQFLAEAPWSWTWSSECFVTSWWAKSLPARTAVAQVVGARPYRGVSSVSVGDCRRCPLGSCGSRVNLPTWQVLGGFRTEIPAYASTTTFSTNEEFLEVADQCLELGYSAVKLHAYGDAKKDAQLCAALRAHVGDDVPLMYDGSAGFDLNDAVYLGRALSDEGYFWYEEPCESSAHGLQVARGASERAAQCCRDV